MEDNVDEARKLFRHRRSSSRGRNTHWIVPTSADNTCAKSLLLSLIVGNHLDQSGNREPLRLIMQPLSYWKCKFPGPAKIQLIQEEDYH